MRVFESLTDFIEAEGESLGTTSWMEVTQEKVDLFADATGDHQWIHVDPAKAAEGPFGGTIAHGLFTLSLLPVFLHELYAVEGISMAVNYGLNKVRFPAPVPVGARVRATSRIDAVEKLEGAAQGTLS
ncbi:MAG TPA: MaoC family dehydratase, partial [Nocardioidaceae bacterium]|nr:MaoC family dehydratase [Nocardioidaceae bacterium]